MIQKTFEGHTLTIATMHGKEAVLEPVLREKLGVRVAVPENIDTDSLGTFSGEVPRTHSPLETARRKCLLAHETTGASLVLASEGSFGGHPVMGFIPADEELLLLRDFGNDIEYKARVLSTRTNFAGNDYNDWDDVLFFAAQVSFPSHGLIARPAGDNYSEIHKGIRSWDRLKESFHYFLHHHKSVRIETDMRALHNPTRMKVIGEAAQKLVELLYEGCPRCTAPGFGVREVIRGLPCSQCQEPTNSARALVYICPHCGHAETKPAATPKPVEDPMFCNTCNP
ncbi:MAG: hypothetical protein EOO16_06740 [Chitinophagaceae bacterium]|nr:MAG: hypothetical protein EOO16_06740 [Chitinophagaceae bacterium]